MRNKLVFLITSSLLLLGSNWVEAQVTTTTMLGTVTDKSGAAVAGAQVTATNTGTRLGRTVQSNAQGEYRIEFLPVGTYTLEVTASGFKKFVRDGLVLEVAQPARADAALEVGQVAETVTVTDVPPLVNTTNPELGRTVENVEINELPIVNRNPYTLLDLTPGVQRNENSIVLGYPEQRTLINGGVDGGAGSVNYYLDGGINITGLRNTGNILPNPDALQEFRVQTNSYSAEFGRFAGGVINALTKSGTNDYHGSLFEFVRNTSLNANDWGASTAIPKPPLHRNQFGGTIGGPIIKGKTFFFGSYSGLRQIISQFLNGAIVPTALERGGDFSQSSAKPFQPGTNQRFPGDIVPVDPVAAQITNKFIPTANLPGNKWQGSIPSPFDTDEFLAKVDHALSKNHQLTVSYFETSGTNTTRAGTGNLPWSNQRFNWRQHNANLSETWMATANLVNQAWLSYTRNFGGRLNLPQTSLGDLGSQFTIQGTPSLPQITVTNLFTLTNAIAGPLAGSNFYSIRDVISYTRGRHSLKVGGESSLDKDIQQTLLNNYGVFSFNGNATAPVVSGNRQPGGNPLADFELGLPNSISQDAPVTGYTNSWSTAFFVQDDFRIHPRFTLNLGLRYDVQTPPTDPLDRGSTYVAGSKSLKNPAAPVGELFVGDPGVTRGIVPVRWHHISPRVGFAWDPFGDGRTSIRAGAGVFYGSVSGNEWNATTNFEPFAIRLTFTNTGNVTNPAGGGTLSKPYQGLLGGNPFPYHGQFVSGGTISGVAQNFQWPYTYQFNFSVQRQVTSDLSVMLGYVGNLSHDLPFAQDVNYPVVTPSASTSNIQARRPNPGFGSDPGFGPVLLVQSNQTASYNGFQVTVAKRMSKHFTLNAFYTFSKTFNSVQLDNSTTQGGSQNMANLREDRGRADTDQRHMFNLSAVWQPDYYSGGNSILRGILTGWEISPIVKLRSGLPFTILNGSDANFDGNNTDRAQLVGDPHLSHRGPGAWFNTAAFARNNPQTGRPIDGNSPRNFLDRPGFRDVDLAISRTFKIWERVALQFRAEASNAFNLVSLGAPGATVPATTATPSNFGQINSASPMRQIQLGLRLTF